MKSFPTTCLLWLSQAIDCLEEQIDFPALQDGLYHWIEQLLPQLESLTSQASEGAGLALLDYCEDCLEVWHEMSAMEQPDSEPLSQWRNQLILAGSFFSEAEQFLNHPPTAPGLYA